MNRRDFLLFRTEQRTRILELSCERLYMRFLDSQVAAGARDGVDHVGGGSWEGEPPAVLDLPTAQELFEELDRELRSADILRVTDNNWLASDEFRREFEALIAAFRARGGRVEYSTRR